MTDEEFDYRLDRERKSFRAFREIGGQMVYDNRVTWICPFCEVAEVTAEGEAAILNALETSGYCQECDEAESRADKHESEELTRLESLQVSQREQFGNEF